MTSTPSDPSRTRMSAEEMTTLIGALQREIVGVKTETTVKVASLQDTITPLCQRD